MLGAQESGGQCPESSDNPRRSVIWSIPLPGQWVRPGKDTFVEVCSSPCSRPVCPPLDICFFLLLLLRIYPHFHFLGFHLEPHDWHTVLPIAIIHQTQTISHKSSGEVHVYIYQESAQIDGNRCHGCIDNWNLITHQGGATIVLICVLSE